MQDHSLHAATCGSSTLVMLGQRSCKGCLMTLHLITESFHKGGLLTSGKPGVQSSCL